MTLSHLIDTTVVVCYLTGYALYYWNVFRSGTSPNLSSWIAWAFSSGVSLLVYIGASSQRTYVLNLLIDAVLCSSVVLVGWKRGRFLSLPAYQKVCLGIALLVILLKLCWSSLPSEVLIGLTMLTGISFIPSVATALDGSAREPLLPWAAWSTSLAVSMVATLMASPTFNAAALPVLSFAGHFSILLASAYARLHRRCPAALA